ncbi:hypothetical protein BT69DRAFT_1289468 [Atractiella rhizophila]|nr:hypothetical protein BT69DRAFT_1289468 [Atractiella rhizophila]
METDQLNAFFNSLTSNPFYPSRDGNVDLTTTTEEEDLSSYLNSPVPPSAHQQYVQSNLLGMGGGGGMVDPNDLLSTNEDDIFRAIQSGMWSNHTTSLSAIESRPPPLPNIGTAGVGLSNNGASTSASALTARKDDGSSKRRKSSIANISARPATTAAGPILSTAARVSKGANFVPPATSSLANAKKKNAVTVTGRDVPVQMLSDREILTTRWYSTAQLKDIGKERGREIYKKGKFTHDEELKIKSSLDSYMSKHGLDFEGLREKVFSGRTRNADPSSSFWSEIADSVEGRPLISVYQHVRRMCHPLSHQGAWTAEQDAMLLEAVEELGTKWEKVSARVERMAQDCRDRYRNYLKNGELKNRGAWSKEETQKLKEAVESVCRNLGRKKGDYSDIPWTAVSEKMEWVRTRAQCRIKWQDSVEKEVKAERGEAEMRPWDQDDTFYMFEKLKGLRVADESEIDWDSLRDKKWNLFSSHQIQKRFLSLKRTVKNHKELSFREIMDAIQADFDAFKKSKRPRRKGEHPKKKQYVFSEDDMFDD